jgi:proteasome accessory factor BC
VYRGAESDREVAGYAVLFQGGHWYLIGNDATRDDVRVFRVGRMADVVANERALNTPDYEVPDDFDLQDYVDRRPWELGERDEEPLSVEVQFRFPQSLWAERNAYGRALRSNADGSSVRLFEVHQVNPFLRWILSQEGEAQISGPPELIDELRGLAQAIEGAHEGGYDARR